MKHKVSKRKRREMENHKQLVVNNCRRKVRYETQQEADAYAVKFSDARFVRDYKPKKSYYCNICYGFHLTSQC